MSDELKHIARGEPLPKATSGDRVFSEDMQAELIYDEGVWRVVGLDRICRNARTTDFSPLSEVRIADSLVVGARGGPPALVLTQEDWGALTASVSGHNGPALVTLGIDDWLRVCDWIRLVYERQERLRERWLTIHRGE